jgi:hypothetical protein
MGNTHSGKPQKSLEKPDFRVFQEILIPAISFELHLPILSIQFQSRLFTLHTNSPTFVGCPAHQAVCWVRLCSGGSIAILSCQRHAMGNYHSEKTQCEYLLELFENIKFGEPLNCLLQLKSCKDWWWLLSQQKLTQKFMSVETYWHDHSLESSRGALSDSTICFSILKPFLVEFIFWIFLKKLQSQAQGQGILANSWFPFCGSFLANHFISFLKSVEILKNYHIWITMNEWMNIPDLYSAHFKQMLVHRRFTDVEINPPR